MTGNRDAASPKFGDLLAVEEKLLRARLDAARAVLSVHSGELGASLEHEARAFLRTFLPQEYGLGRGFVVWREPSAEADATWSFGTDRYKVAISSQMDIIVYDAVRGGPLADLGSSQIFPIEHVYGYVEVKAVFVDDLRHVLEVSRDLRAPNLGFYRARPEGFRPLMTDAGWQILNAQLTAGKGRANTALDAPLYRPRLSCWVIAFQYERQAPASRTTEDVRSKFESTWKDVGHYAHLGGVLLAELQTNEGSAAAFLRSIPAHSGEDEFKSELFIDRAIGRFKSQMLTDLVVSDRMPTDVAVLYDGYWTP